MENRIDKSERSRADLLNAAVAPRLAALDASLASAPGNSSARHLRIEGYEIWQVLGRGGVGIVYKAKHLFTGRIVAIKVLSSTLVESSFARIQQEAKALCKFDHPNMVSIYDFGMTADGLPFLIMEYVSGSTLSDLIKLKGPLPWDAALKTFMQISQALEHAHMNGVVHRDLKPGNIMVLNPEDRESRIKVLDFGLAKIVTEAQSSLHLTATGEVFGSPHYMSPEQCSGLKTDLRTDIYSLGCVMYESLVGRPPHLGDNPFSLIMKHLNETPTHFAELRSDLHLPKGLESIVFRALEKDPKDRFQSMAQVHGALSDLTDKRLIRRLHGIANVHRPRSFRLDARVLAGGFIAMAILVAVLSSRQIHEHSSPLTSTTSPAIRENRLAQSTQVGEVAPPVAAKNVSANKVAPALQLEAEIAAALPVSNEDISKAIIAAAILPDDVPIHISRKQDMITVNTNRSQKTENELKVAAIVIASKVGKLDRKAAGVSVVFHHPEYPAAYDEIAFSKEQLKTLRGGDLKNQKFLASVKVTASQLAKSLESASAEVRTPVSNTANATLPSISSPAVISPGIGSPGTTRADHQLRLASLVRPVVRVNAFDPALAPRQNQRIPAVVVQSAGAPTAPTTETGKRLLVWFSGQNPKYLDNLGSMFDQYRIPLPSTDIRNRLRRMRLALHLLAMKRHQQSGEPAAEDAYQNIESLQAQQNLPASNRLLHITELDLGLPSMLGEDPIRIIQVELQNL